MKERIARLAEAMTAYDHGDARRIQHFIKVHDFAAAIGRIEQVGEPTLDILEAAALVHDIGIHLSEQKYGSSAGKYQELEGPAEARKLLGSVGGFSAGEIDRICFLVGHHHTYTGIDGIDYQILVEADFLVNIYEDGLDKKAALAARGNIFRTEAGIRLLNAMFDLEK